MQKNKRRRQSPGWLTGRLGIIMGIDDEEPDEHDEHDSQYIPCSKQGNYWPGKPLPRTEYRSSLKAVEGEKGLFFFFFN